MIRQTLATTQAATFAVVLPNPHLDGMPTPRGTGFFVSPDGFFVTARHVLVADQTVRDDIGATWLQKEPRLNTDAAPTVLTGGVELVHDDPDLDLALLRVPFEGRREEWLKGRDGFPFVRVSTRPLDEGEPVYAFGYPLSEGGVVSPAGSPVTVGTTSLSPRVTSAIVASTIERTAMLMTSADPVNYVLDKALNYGNSGGPIIATQTGHIHAVCTRFQPVEIAQLHHRDADGNPLVIAIPSLYGVGTSVANQAFAEVLRGCGVELRDD